MSYTTLELRLKYYMAILLEFCCIIYCLTWRGDVKGCTGTTEALLNSVNISVSFVVSRLVMGIPEELLRGFIAK